MGISLEDAFREAISESRVAMQHGDVPVGAVVVFQGEIIARRHNERELRQDPTAHAEILAIRDAALEIGNRRLVDCCLFVTLEPCVMCAAAIIHARLREVSFCLSEPKTGAIGSVYNLVEDPRLGGVTKSRLVSNHFRDEYLTILQTFFDTLR